MLATKISAKTFFWPKRFFQPRHWWSASNLPWNPASLRRTLMAAPSGRPSRHQNSSQWGVPIGRPWGKPNKQVDQQNGDENSCWPKQIVVENELLKNQKLRPSGLEPPNLKPWKNGSWRKTSARLRYVRSPAFTKLCTASKTSWSPRPETSDFLSMFESWSKFHPRPPLDSWNLVKTRHNNRDIWSFPHSKWSVVALQRCPEPLTENHVARQSHKHWYFALQIDQKRGVSKHRGANSRYCWRCFHPVVVICFDSDYTWLVKNNFWKDQSKDKKTYWHATYDYSDWIRMLQRAETKSCKIVPKIIYTYYHLHLHMRIFPP